MSTRAFLVLSSVGAMVSAGMVELDVNMSSFLSRHDMTWEWEWGAGGAYTLQPIASEFSFCGAHGTKGDCCLGIFPDSHAVGLQECDPSQLAQQWLMSSNGSVTNAQNLQCLTSTSSGSQIVTAACDPAKTVGWAQYEGFWMVTAPNAKKPHNIYSLGARRSGTECFMFNVPSFCTDTVCPNALASNFTTNTTAIVSGCHNGDRSQLMAAFTLPSASRPTPTQNLVPLTWAVSAYVGNGLVGARMQSEEGVGCLHLILDNVMLGALQKRKPTGYFRFMVADPNSGPYTVKMTQRIFNSYLEGTVTSSEGQVVTSFSLFVNADLDLPVVVLRAKHVSGTQPPSVQWVSRGSTDFAFHNATDANGVLSLVASAQAPDAPLKAAEVVARARAMDKEEMLRNSTAWWAGYWNQSFVTLPVTRVEALYFVEMYRFPASDRVVLHGLMGAFGPTDNYNLWPDDVWDMNEQVMYWIGAASHRPQITSPMEAWFEAERGVTGGLWMAHNYVKQVRFEGDDHKMVAVAWPKIVAAVKAQAGGSESSPGSLKKLSDGLYHIVGCSSPEYRCYAPFQARACNPSQDCNYGLSQLRWGLRTALEGVASYNLSQQLHDAGVDIAWWQSLMDGKLAWYPYDNVTGFRLDSHCAFDCPHRHFSHLLQIYDLETVQYDSGPSGNATLNKIIENGVDNWYRVTCNDSNWFNEECRGFTQCALASFSSLLHRPASAQGNLSNLIGSVITPNGMYGEMVYQGHPNEFAPVSESAYCGAGVVHTMLLHTNPSTGVLSVFPGFGSTWADGAFYRLRADGGLVVSASRRDHSTQFIAIESIRSRSVRVRVPDDPRWASDIPRVIPQGSKVTPGGSPGEWEVEIEGGTDGVVLFTDDAGPPFRIEALASNKNEEHYFGYNRPMQPLH